MNKTYKYRIYPNEVQQALINKTFECCDLIWNLMLEDKIKYYEENKKMLWNTPAKYKKVHEELKTVDAFALCNVQLNLESAFRLYFNDKGRGFPKYKTGANQYHAYKTNLVGKNIIIGEHDIRLPKLGKIKASIYRNAPDDYVLKGAWIVRKNENYYCHVLYEMNFESEAINICTNKVLGLDYKSACLYMDSNGNTAGEHRFYRNAMEKSRRMQQRLARMERGSKNYNKELRKYQKWCEHIANQRMDFLHNLSKRLAEEYDLICVEKLELKKMKYNGYMLSRATYDNSYRMFLDMLAYKMAVRGKRLIYVDQYYPSSQICSCCGKRKKIAQSERIYSCKCGNVMDRDWNAAINIRNEGLRIYLSEKAS